MKIALPVTDQILINAMDVLLLLISYKALLVKLLVFLDIIKNLLIKHVENVLVHAKLVIQLQMIV